jgi:hypothetical protein
MSAESSKEPTAKEPTKVGHAEPKKAGKAELDDTALAGIAGGGGITPMPPPDGGGGFPTKGSSGDT